MEPSTDVLDAPAEPGTVARFWQALKNGPFRLYCAGAIGGLLLGLADLTKEEGALVARLAELFGGRLFQSTLVTTHGELFALLFLVSIAALACWIFEPKTKVDAFARGLSIFALLNLTPAPPVPDAHEALPSSEEDDITVETAFIPVQQRPARPAPVQVEFLLESPEALGEAISLVTLRDPETARLIYRDHWKGKMIQLEFDSAALTNGVRVELAVPGHRRTSFLVRPEANQESLYKIKLDPTWVPLGFQQLLGFKNLGEAHAESPPDSASRHDGSLNL